MVKEKKVLLLIDQSLVVLERMIPLLEALPNVQFVLHAGTYERAMGLLGEMQPNMILMDIDLPDGSGIELLRTVKARFENVIVFVTTNFVTDQYRDLCQRLGARAFFDKSGDYEEITEAVACMA